MAVESPTAPATPTVGSKILRVVGTVGSGKSTFANKLVGDQCAEKGYVQHFHASDRPEGQRVDATRAPVGVARPSARTQSLAVVDTEGWGSLQDDTIAVVDHTLGAMKTQPCVVFVVAKFGRVETELAKRVQLLRFCTGMGPQNCFLVLTFATETRHDGTFETTARQRDATAFVERINALTRVDEHARDLFAVGDNVASVGNDPDTETTMEEICATMASMTPIATCHSYTEMKDVLIRDISALQRTLRRTEKQAARKQSELDDNAAEQLALVQLSQREREKYEKLRSAQGVPRVLLDAAEANSASTVHAFKQHKAAADTRRATLFGALQALELVAVQLLHRTAKTREQLDQWRALLGDVSLRTA